MSYILLVTVMLIFASYTPGHLLPGLHHPPYRSPTPHSSPPHRLAPLQEQLSDSIIKREASTEHALSSEASWEFPLHHSTLPPIQVPSQPDGPLAVHVH